MAQLEELVNGRLYVCQLADGTQVPLVAMNLGSGWQFLDDCPSGDRCTHGRHAHLVARPGGTFEADISEEPSEHDLDVRMVREGRTLAELEPANRLARAVFLSVNHQGYPCPRCNAADGLGHHPQCHLENLIPLYPMFDVRAWRAEIEDLASEGLD